MRAIVVVGLLALLCPAAAAAQTGAPPAPSTAAASPAPRRGGDITRDEYIERAKQAAARRFDAMNTSHSGVLTAEERRAWREAHSRRRSAASPAPQPTSASH